MVAERDRRPEAGHMNYDTIPWVIYTSPEIAWVGPDRAAAQGRGARRSSRAVPVPVNGRALGIGDTTGFVKIVADATTDEMLGVHIIGPRARRAHPGGGGGDGVRAASEDIARIVHAHPSLPRRRKAALVVDKRTLNSERRRNSAVYARLVVPGGVLPSSITRSRVAAVRSDSACSGGAAGGLAGANAPQHLRAMGGVQGATLQRSDALRRPPCRAASTFGAGSGAARAS